MSLHLRFATVAAVALAFAATQSQAKPCRDAQGHFAACPAPAAAAGATQRCRDAKGHFAACAATGTAANTGASARAPTNTAAVTTPPVVRPAPAPRASMARASRAPTGVASNTASTAPGVATARCRDGSLSYSQHRSGTCASHGGVAQWM